MVGSALSVNEIHVHLLFWRTIINLKPNPNEAVSGRRIGLCITLTRNHAPCQWSILFSGQWTEDIPRNETGNKPICLVTLLVCSINIYSKVEDYETENNKHEQEKTAAALVSTSSHYQVPRFRRTQVCRRIICCTVYLQKMMPHTNETFCERQIHWTSPLFLCLVRLAFN